MESLSKKTGLEEMVRFGSVWNALIEYPDFFRFAVRKNPFDYSLMEASVPILVLAEENFSTGSSCKACCTGKNTQRSDLWQPNIEDKNTCLHCHSAGCL